MRKFSKVILFILIAIGGICLALFVGVNLWLQSEGVQTRLKMTVEDALGTPLHVRSTFYTPWGGISLSGITAPNTTAVPVENFLEAKSFSLRFDFLPLLQKRFVISQIRLDEPTLIWRQGKDGKWRLPQSQAIGDAGKTFPSFPAKTELPVRTIPEPPPPHPSVATPERIEVVSEEKPSFQMPKFAVEIRHISIRDAKGIFYDSKGVPLASFKNLLLRTDIKADGTINGHIRIGECTFRNMLHIRELRGRFTKQGDIVLSDNIKGDLAGGELSGEVSIVGVEGPSPTFQAGLDMKNVHFKTLLQEAGINPKNSSGRLAGQFRLNGSFQSEKDLAGKGHLSLLDGRLEPVDFIQQVGQVLNVKDLQLLILKKADLDFVVREEKFRVEKLTLQSENTAFQAKGYIRFNGNINLDAKLAIDPEIQKQLRSLAEDIFQPSEDPELAGYRELPFSVKGTVSRPQSDIWSKVANRFGGFLKGFLPAPSQPSASATPAPSP